MNAELLREAAEVMREPYSEDETDSAFLFAVAALLDGMAYSCELDGHAPNRLALDVARAYLGTRS